MRPVNDVTHPGPDPVETIHFLRASNDQWQATAERLARQRDRYYEAVRDIDTALCRMDEPRDTVTAIEEIVERATLGIAT